ncbi:hypothetical protein ACFW9M_12125 [Streptomyces lydicus]|uniref:hypothetical protein n=1 Tax=Streptomyces lydicus TaxID=47763 RepID=UPI0036A70C69
MGNLLLRKLGRSLPVALAAVALSAAPAMADAQGNFNIVKSGHSKASGRIVVNERFSDDKVWFKGSITKLSSRGCDWLEADGHKISEVCGKKGTKKWMNKAIIYGIFGGTSLEYRLCHEFGDGQTCSKSKTFDW